MDNLENRKTKFERNEVVLRNKDLKFLNLRQNTRIF